MFNNEIVEFLSKTPWYAIPLAYIPLNIWMISNFTGSIVLNIFMITMGIVSWGLAEYILHRFVFHGEDTWMKNIPCNGPIYAFHFMIHGIHHAFP